MPHEEPPITSEQINGPIARPTSTVTAAAPPPPPAVTVTVTPPPPPAAAPPLKTVQPQPQGMLADDRFLEYVNNHGFHPAKPGMAITSAHDACGYMAAGHSREQTAVAWMAVNPDLTLDELRVFVDGAAYAYCPERV